MRSVGENMRDPMTKGILLRRAVTTSDGPACRSATYKNRSARNCELTHQRLWTVRMSEKLSLASSLAFSVEAL